MAWQASKFGVGMVPTEPLNESFVTWGVEKDFGCFNVLISFPDPKNKLATININNKE
jgi:hypothetical protein